MVRVKHHLGLALSQDLVIVFKMLPMLVVRQVSGKEVLIELLLVVLQTRVQVIESKSIIEKHLRDFIEVFIDVQGAFVEHLYTSAVRKTSLLSEEVASGDDLLGIGEWEALDVKDKELTHERRPLVVDIVLVEVLVQQSCALQTFGINSLFVVHF